jgi:hypothetical protein
MFRTGATAASSVALRRPAPDDDVACQRPDQPQQLGVLRPMGIPNEEIADLEKGTAYLPPDAASGLLPGPRVDFGHHLATAAFRHRVSP